MGVSTRTPMECISAISFEDSGLVAPDRDGQMIFLAPRATIHRVMLRPSPPSPPDIM